MSEKLLTRVAAGTALVGTAALGAVAMNNDRAVQPELGNNPAAVARFDEALHGRANVSPLPENPADHKIEVAIPYTVQPKDTATKIFDEHATPGDDREKDIANIESQGSGPNHMLMVGDHIKLTGDLADGVPAQVQNGGIPVETHQYGE